MTAEKKLVGKDAADLGWAQMELPKETEIFGPKLKIVMWVAIGIILAGLFLPLILTNAPVLPLFTRLLALSIAILIPYFLGRKRLMFLAIWLALYLTAYGILSARGAYIGANHGGKDNRDTWYPGYCGESYWSRSGRQKSSLRPLGCFFLPLVIADRWFIHPTKYDSD